MHRARRRISRASLNCSSPASKRPVTRPTAGQTRTEPQRRIRQTRQETETPEPDDANSSAVTPVQVAEPQKPILPFSIALAQQQENATAGEKATPDEIAQGPAQQPAQVLSPSLAAVAQLPELQQPAALKQSMKARQSAQALQRLVDRDASGPATNRSQQNSSRCHSRPFRPWSKTFRCGKKERNRKIRRPWTKPSRLPSPASANGFASGPEVARRSRGAGCLSGSRNAGSRALQSLGAGFRRAHIGGSTEVRPGGRRRSISIHLNPQSPSLARRLRSKFPCGMRPRLRLFKGRLWEPSRELSRTDPRKTPVPRPPARTREPIWCCRSSKP